MNLSIKTPLYKSFKYSTKNRNVFYKMEAFQPSGSFKLRGIGLLCSSLSEKGIKKFVIASGGNAGMAVAYCGLKLGIETFVVVPESTPFSMQQKIIDLGANLEVKGSTWNDAHEYALELTQQENSFYIHPYDHPLLWEGHSVIVKDLVDNLDSEPDCIILSVGGGGLFCGIMEGLDKVGWNICKVICSETYGTSSLATSLTEGKHISLDKIDGIATSLGAKKIADKAWQYAQNERVISFLCDDRDALEACNNFLDEYRVMTEPACGAALAALANPLTAHYKNVVVIVCGGAVMNLETMKMWNERLGINR